MLAAIKRFADIPRRLLAIGKVHTATLGHLYLERNTPLNLLRHSWSFKPSRYIHVIARYFVVVCVCGLTESKSELFEDLYALARNYHRSTLEL